MLEGSNNLAVEPAQTTFGEAGVLALTLKQHTRNGSTRSRAVSSMCQLKSLADLAQGQSDASGPGTRAQRRLYTGERVINCRIVVSQRDKPGFVPAGRQMHAALQHGLEESRKPFVVRCPRLGKIGDFPPPEEQSQH